MTKVTDTARSLVEAWQDECLHLGLSCEGGRSHDLLVARFEAALTDRERVIAGLTAALEALQDHHCDGVCSERSTPNHPAHSAVMRQVNEALSTSEPFAHDRDDAVRREALGEAAEVADLAIKYGCDVAAAIRHLATKEPHGT